MYSVQLMIKNKYFNTVFLNSYLLIKLIILNKLLR